MGNTIKKMVSAPLRNAGEYAIPTFLRIMSGKTTTAAPEVLRYAENIAKGADRMFKTTDDLFTGTKIAAQKGYDEKIQRERTKSIIDKGELNKQIHPQLQRSPSPPQKFATGGEVQPAFEQPFAEEQEKPPQGTDGVSTHFPEQAMMLGMAKGRVFNYLNSLRPTTNAPKLAFDEETHDPEAARKYDRAIDVANDPLSVMKHIQDGTLESEHIVHLNNLYPEVTNQLKKKITERIVQAQVDGKKPSYRVRQGLSMLLGTPLDSTMTPQSIQAAQGVFIQKAAAQAAQSGTKPKKNTSKLGEYSKQFETPNQAAEVRQKS